MSLELRLDEDWHVHSTFSDGAGTVEANVEAASERGLRRLGLTDHVRAGTPWVADFVAAVRGLASGAQLEISCGVETKILDTDGELDAPDDYDLADLLVVADHQVPSPSGPLLPRDVKAELERGELAPATVVGWIERATSAAIERHPGLLVAHLFSVLPKIGLTEADVDVDTLERLAAAARRHGTIVEVSERWKCPSADAIGVFSRAGVRIVASTDAHRPEDIGRYRYCREVALGA